MGNPIAVPSVYDYAILGGDVITPGQADILHGKSKRKWDIRRGYGLSGAISVYTGLDIEQFILRLKMWESAQIDYYSRKVVPLLEAPERGKAPAAIKFFHPSVSDPPINIRAVGVVEVSQLEQVEDGLFQVEIVLIPYTGPPKPAVVKPIVAEDTRPKPENERQVLIQKLSDQIQQAANRTPAP